MPGGNKKGGGLKSSPVYKMKGFSGFGDSPVKQKKGGLPKDFNITGSDWPKKTPGYGSTKMAKAAKAARYTPPNIDWTLNDNLNKAVKRITPVTRTGSRATYDAMKNLNVPRVTGPVSAGGTNPPKGVNLEKNYTKGMSEKLNRSAKAYGTDKIGQSKMPKRSFSKAARKFVPKALKFFGSKAFGVGSLMFGTLGTGSTLQASEKFGVKPTKMSDSQRRDVGKELKKAVYEGNKKRYGKNK